VPRTADPHVYFGGPLGTDMLFAVGTAAAQIAGTLDLGDGLRLASGMRSIMALAAARPLPGASPRLKLFRGYAGWGAGQLHAEFEAGAWDVQRASAAMVFDPRPASQWERLTDLARAVRAPAMPRWPKETGYYRDLRQKPF
jgi:putative transcriptional regulator